VKEALAPGGARVGGAAVRRGNDLVHFGGTTRGARPAFHRSRHALRGRAEVRDVTTRGALSRRPDRPRDRWRDVGHHHVFRPPSPA
jgi:hypothetical protein